MSGPDPRISGKKRGLNGASYPLGCHLADTAAIAGALWDLFLTPAQRTMIADAWGIDEAHARQLVMLAAGLHDLGKSTPCFQYEHLKMPPLGPGFEHTPDRTDLPHAYASGLTVPSLLADLGWDLDDTTAQLGQIVAGHHGAFPVMPPPFELDEPHHLEPRLGDSNWHTERRALTQLVHDLCDRPAAPPHEADVLPAALAAALIVLADRLASSTHHGGWVPTQLTAWTTDPHWQRHYQRARTTAPTTVRAHKLAPATWKPLQSFADTFNVPAPRPLQADVARHLPTLAAGPGLLLITDTTGNGKTETAFYAGRIMAEAAGSSGLAVLLPTRATAEAMYLRLRDFIHEHTHPAAPVTLVHATAWLNPHYNPDRGTDEHSTYPPTWMRQRLLGLLATGGMAATWDQAAFAALPTDHNAVRLLGLSNKTVIIDEAHSYDAYGQTVTRALLALLGGLQVPVILMSATLTADTATQLANAYLTGAGQPPLQRLALPYPGWAHIDATTGKTHISDHIINYERARTITTTHHRTRYTHNPNHPDGRATHLLQELAPLTEHRNGNLMVVCNTVDDAQRTHQLLTGRGLTLDLLHARMPRWQRDQATAQLQQRLGRNSPRQPGPFVLVATQIAEQSLDVDFDLVISDLAPLDYLIQRAGRCWRHHRPRPPWASRPRLHVIVPTGSLPPPHWGTDPGVYYGHLLHQTATSLSTLPNGDLREPEDVQHLIEAVYANEASTSAAQARAADEQLKAQLAQLATVPHPLDLQSLHDLSDATGLNTQAAATRLGADTALALPTWTLPDNNQWLHPSPTDGTCGCPDGNTPVPTDIHYRDRDTVRHVLAHTVPVRSHWIDLQDPTTHTPASWHDIGPLTDIRLLPHTGTPSLYRHGALTLRLDPVLGLRTRV
ncbi:CRISPR-associated helicase Cas3' [Streptomyces caniferus]|uniref:CRISPR-associated helicase Cas3' n=1 Tax=Streptomyces caniferus TaxID=285557 RepID=UPI0037F78DB6